MPSDEQTARITVGYIEGGVEDGVLVLEVCYGLEQMLEAGAPQGLSKDILDAHRQVAEQSSEKLTTKSCVVMIKAEIAGSPLVRALFELYKKVDAEGGKVLCVGYPAAYIDSLTALGLTDLPGFGLSASKEEAIAALGSAKER